MLKIIENLSEKTAEQLYDFFSEKPSGLYVLFALLDWTGVDGAWLQSVDGDVTALVVQREQSKVYVTARENADFYELGDFITRLGGMVIHCPADITERIGMTAFSKISLMCIEKEIESPRKSVEINDNLRPVFDLLTQSKRKILTQNPNVKLREVKKYTDRAYNEWLARTSRGIFNGYTSVRAIKQGVNAILSVAVADRLKSSVYIRDVATDNDFRRMGYATDCISGLCSDFKAQGEMAFLACNDLKTENFYKNLGFETKEYMDLGIIEI